MLYILRVFIRVPLLIIPALIALLIAGDYLLAPYAVLTMTCIVSIAFSEPPEKREDDAMTIEWEKKGSPIDWITLPKKWSDRIYKYEFAPIGLSGLIVLSLFIYLLFNGHLPLPDALMFFD